MRSCLIAPQTSSEFEKVINTRHTRQLHIRTDTRSVGLRRRHHCGKRRQFWYRHNHSWRHFWNFTLYVYQFLDVWGSGQFRPNCIDRNRDLFQNCGIIGRCLEWIETHCWSSRTGRYHHSVSQSTFCGSGGFCGDGGLSDAWGDG